MVEPLSARQTLDRALALMASGRGTSLPELLRVIETLSLNVCEVTVSELGEIIEKDTVIVARVIAAANTIAHNPTISPLTTLSQAIHRLGYTRIRTIAVALMLLDTAGGSNPPEQREAAAQALCAGLLAQASAQEVGTHDPELVFACAAMRNFGYIMSAAVSVEHCRLAQQQTGGNLAEAYQAQFGIAPLELARRLLTAARLPAEVIETLRDCEPGSPTAESSNFENRLLAHAEYGTRLAHLTLESTQNPERFADAVRNLGEQFAALLPGAAEFAPRALGGANQRLSDFTVAHGMRGLPTKSLQRVRWRLHQMTETEPADPASAAAPEAPVARPPRCGPTASSSRPCPPRLPRWRRYSPLARPTNAGSSGASPGSATSRCSTRSATPPTGRPAMRTSRRASAASSASASNAARSPVSMTRVQPRTCRHGTAATSRRRRRSR